MSSHYTFNWLASSLQFIGFLVIGAYFSSTAIHQYWQRLTTFAVAHEPLTLEDMPAISLCYFFRDSSLASDSVYDIQYDIQASGVVNRNNFHHTRHYMGHGISTEEQGGAIEIQLKLLSVDPQTWCLSVHLGKHNISIKSIDKAYLTIMLNLPMETMKSVTAYISSKENSYGVPDNALLDGQVAKVALLPGQQIDVDVEVQKTDYISSTCHNTSFYLALGQAITDMLRDKTKFINMTYEEVDYDDWYGNETVTTKPCPMDDFCLTSALPIDLPQLCDMSVPTVVQKYCFKKALNDIKHAMLKEATLKSCHNVDYIRGEKVISDSIFGSSSNDPFVISVDLHTPKSIHSWTPEIKVTAKREYYTIDLITVIGTVGGTIGLFIGYSFLDVSLWLWDHGFNTFKILCE